MIKLLLIVEGLSMVPADVGFWLKWSEVARNVEIRVNYYRVAIGRIVFAH
jgi:hypothetical protein